MCHVALLRKMKKYVIIAIVAMFALMALQIYTQDRKIERLTAERDRYKGNTETLLTDVETFRVRDSLSASRVQSLELTIKEFEKFRAEDAQLIKDLKRKNNDLKSVSKAQEQTIIELSSVPRDTIIIIDSIPVQAKKVHCGDYWYDFDGILTESDFKGTLINRDSLLIAETIRYKRFLWFKTKKVKSREINAVSLNPHTEIMGMEHIIIE